MFDFDFKNELDPEIENHYEDFCNLSKKIELIYDEQQERIDWTSEEVMKLYSSLYNNIVANVLEKYHKELLNNLQNL